MLVLQQIDVLPAGSDFRIEDENKVELEGFISSDDHSIGFLTAYESDKYHKIYSTFRVIELKAELGVKVVSDGKEEQEIIYVIKVR